MHNVFVTAFLLRVAGCCLIAGCVCIPSAHAEPKVGLKKVLVIFNADNWSSPADRMIYSGLKAVFDQAKRSNVVLMGETLPSYYFTAEPAEQLKKADAFRSRYKRENIDIVIPVGPAGLRFVLRHRGIMFPDTPIVFCAYPAYELRYLDGVPDITGVSVTVEIAGTIDLATSLMPGTKRLALVAGSGPLDSYLKVRAREIFKSTYSGQLELIDLTNLPMAGLLERVAALPEKTIILFTNMVLDGDGIPFVSAEAMQMVTQSANVPLFNLLDSALGFGSVGGRLTTLEAYARKSAELALRVLDGEAASSIRPVVMTENPAMFDWRQLKRWGIEESDLPPGSTVRFKERTLWEEFRWWIVGAFVVVCGLLLLVFMLGSNLVRRRRAEREAAEMRQNLVHVARVSTVGQLGQTIAHEINQPLAAMRMNAEVACQLLAASPPNLEEAHAALGDIVADSKRVQEVVASVRSLVQNRQTERARIGLNQVAADTIQVMRALAESKGVEVRRAFQTDLPPVDGDKVQLQQVVLNLVLNAMEAVSDSPGAPRTVTVRTARVAGGSVELNVTDTGPGIDPETARHLFTPFFTTKPEGLGLGLPICRAIAEAHGGSLSLASNLQRGAAFVLRLPAAPERRREPRSERSDP